MVSICTHCLPSQGQGGIEARSSVLNIRGLIPRTYILSLNGLRVFDVRQDGLADTNAGSKCVLHTVGGRHPTDSDSPDRGGHTAGRGARLRDDMLRAQQGRRSKRSCRRARADANHAVPKRMLVEWCGKIEAYECPQQ